MPYEKDLADRLRAVMRRRRNVVENRMFGGIAFMVNGHMCCGVAGKNLVLRLGEEGADKALKRRHVREMDFTGKPIKTMVYVDPPGYKTDDALRKWVTQAAACVSRQPAKS